MASFTASAADSAVNCILCKNDKHPLYACTWFKSLSHNKMMSTLKANSLCINGLRPGHFVKLCKSLHRCRKWQKPHHTLLHVESEQCPLTAIRLHFQSCHVQCSRRTDIQIPAHDLSHSSQCPTWFLRGSLSNPRVCLCVGMFGSDPLSLSPTPEHQDLRGSWSIPQLFTPICCKLQDILHTTTKQENRRYSRHRSTRNV